MKTRGALKADASGTRASDSTRGSSISPTGSKKGATPVTAPEDRGADLRKPQDALKSPKTSAKKGGSTRGSDLSAETGEAKEKKKKKSLSKKKTKDEVTESAPHIEPKPKEDWEKKWDMEMDRQKKAMDDLQERILRHVIQNDALSSQSKRDMSADTVNMMAPTDAHWEPYLLAMGATPAESRRPDTDLKKGSSKGDASSVQDTPKQTEWQGVPRWKAVAWKRQREYFKITRSWDEQIGRQAPPSSSTFPGRSTTGSGRDVSLASHPTLRASYFGIEYREWYALLLAACPFPPRAEILEWLITQRLPLEWHAWSRATEAGEERWSYLTTDDLDGEWAPRCIQNLQRHLLTAPGWQLGRLYPIFLNNRLRYDELKIQEIYLSPTAVLPPSPSTPSTEKSAKKGSASSRKGKCSTKATTTSDPNTGSEESSDYMIVIGRGEEAKDGMAVSNGVAAKMVPCQCRWGDIVIVGKATGEAYVVDERNVCIPFVPNDRESETIGTQLPPAFQVPRPFPVHYWYVPDGDGGMAYNSSQRKEYRFRISDWLDTLQPRQFVVNFDADAAHYTGEVTFRTMKETQSEVPWCDADNKDWWLMNEMDADIKADGKSPDNSRMQWATLAFPLGVEPGTGKPLSLIVYVWQRGTQKVTDEACWAAVRDRENLLEPMPTGGQRLRTPTPAEVVRLHESDGA